MIFGNPETFAVEIGELMNFPGFPGTYIQFRFWVGNVPIGDWNDRISLRASTESAFRICEAELERNNNPFDQAETAELFKSIYEAYFSCDYINDPVSWRSLSAFYHLDQIGMGAIEDKFGLILVTTKIGMERVIVKDLKKSLFLADISMPIGFVESILRDYIAWGRNQLDVGDICASKI